MNKMADEILFCDWEIESKDFEQAGFFSLSKLSRYKVIFFDPLNFALKNKLRKNGNDLWVRENIFLTEIAYQDYVAKIKEAVDQIRDFIYCGGIFVICSMLPNSHITVRKKSSLSGSQYVQSVISPFFWLEEFLGKYSFQYVKENTLRFLDEENIFHRVFKNTTIKCQQTQNVIPKAKTEVIADSGKQSRLPIITRVTFAPKKGELFFVPKFIVKEECRILAETFIQIADDTAMQSLRPSWLINYERELALASQYTQVIDEINFEIEKLKKKKASLLHKKNESEIYTDLLYKSDDELLKVVKKSLRLMGLISPEPPLYIEKAKFDFYYRDKLAPHIVGQVVSTEEGSISLELFEQFLEKLDGCKLKKGDKAIFVANADFLIDPAKRREWFDEKIIAKSKAREICLLTTSELFIVACYLLGRSDSSSGKAIKESLKKDLLACDAVFRFNQQKFFARR